jgi:hypothetical protein
MVGDCVLVVGGWVCVCVCVCGVFVCLRVVTFRMCLSCTVIACARHCL